MSVLFQVCETKPPRYVINGFSSTILDMAYLLAAQDAGGKVLGRTFFDDAACYAYTIFGNLADRTSAADLTGIVDVLTNWLDNIEPQFAAIEGEIGYNISPGVHRTITTADGLTHGTRAKAATHTLKLMMAELRSKLSDQCVRAICNANKYGTPAASEITAFRYERGVISLFATTNSATEYEFPVKRVKKMRDAIAEMARVKSLTYTVE